MTLNCIWFYWCMYVCINSCLHSAHIWLENVTYFLCFEFEILLSLSTFCIWTSFFYLKDHFFVSFKFDSLIFPWTCMFVVQATQILWSILIMHFDFAFTIFLFLRLRLWIDIGHLKSSSIYHNKNASTYHAICSLSVKLSTSHVLLLITELLRKFKVIQNVEKHIKIEQQEERTDISHVDQNHSYNSTDSPPQQIIHLSPWQTPLAIRAPFKIKHNLITKTCQITSIHF